MLDSVEGLTSELHSRVDRNELNLIPKPYPALRQFYTNATILKSALDNVRNTFDSSSNLKKENVELLEDETNRIWQDAERLQKAILKQQTRAQSLSLESMSGLEDVLTERAKIGAQVELLDDFARGERHLTAHRALKEARHLLRGIKDVKLMDFVAGANDVYDSVSSNPISIISTSKQSTLS